MQPSDRHWSIVTQLQNGQKSHRSWRKLVVKFGIAFGPQRWILLYILATSDASFGLLLLADEWIAGGRCGLRHLCCVQSFPCLAACKLSYPRNEARSSSQSSSPKRICCFVEAFAPRNSPVWSESCRTVAQYHNILWFDRKQTPNRRIFIIHISNISLDIFRAFMCVECASALCSARCAASICAAPVTEKVSSEAWALVLKHGQHGMKEYERMMQTEPLPFRWSQHIVEHLQQTPCDRLLLAGLHCSTYCQAIIRVDMLLSEASLLSAKAICEIWCNQLPFVLMATANAAQIRTVHTCKRLLAHSLTHTHTHAHTFVEYWNYVLRQLVQEPSWISYKARQSGYCMDPKRSC